MILCNLVHNIKVLIFLIGIPSFGFTQHSQQQNADQEDWATRFSVSYFDPQQAAHTCQPPNQCIPVSTCPVYANILNHACMRTDKIGTLGCGYPGSGYVCCPKMTAVPAAPQQPPWAFGSNPSVISNTMTTKKTVNSMEDEHKCGMAIVQGENYRGIGAQPWVVRIGFKNTVSGEIKFPCAGSILNHRVILTAAHCALAKADNYKLVSIRAGEWRTDSSLDCSETFCSLPVQDIAISHVIVHPGYEHRTFKNDIALLILRVDINYTVTAQPICLIEPWSEHSSYAFLVGWGKSAGQHTATPFQQIVDLPVVNRQQCVAVYGRSIPITDDHLCAGGEYGKDACEGFGGAPLVVKHNDVHYQVGIMSFGSNQCGAAGIPSVYTSIKKFTTWVKENTPVIYT